MIEQARYDMAHVLEARGAYGARESWLAALRESIAQRIRWNAAYRETRRELERLSDRELADLGLARESIRAIASQAAYDTVL